jgi:hypothetical protein
LLAHPCIDDAAVIVCLRANDVTEVPRLTAERINVFVAERLASYRRLDSGIVFVDEIPRRASGKIQRFKLAQMDQFRNSITELLMPNDDAVKVEDVRDLKSRAATRRTILELGQQSSYQAALTISASFKPKRQCKLSLRAKMKALRESSLMITQVIAETGLTELSAASTMPASS